MQVGVAVLVVGLFAGMFGYGIGAIVGEIRAYHDIKNTPRR